MIAVADPRRDDPLHRALIDQLRLAVGSGYSAAVLPLASRLRGAPPHSGAMRHLFEHTVVALLRPDLPVDAGLLIAHDPEVFRQVQEVVPDVRARHAVLALDLVALTGPGSDGTARSPADLADDVASGQRLFAIPWTIRPIGDDARRWLAEHGPDLPVDGSDWPRGLDSPGTAKQLLADLIGDPPDPAEAADLSDPPEPTDPAGPAGAGGTAPRSTTSPWRIGPLGRVAAASPPAARIAFFTDNGHGLGHITRLMAIARHLPEHHTAVFLTLSESHPLVRRMGFPVEHFPSRHRFGIELPRWEAMLRIRLERFLERTRPAVLVIDHGSPPRIVTEVARQAGVQLVWSRRGMWKAGRNRAALALEDRFDVTIEPGDLAAPLDRGPTRGETTARRIAPITLTGRDDLLPRDRARVELGLPADGPALLLQLAADNTQSLIELTRGVRDQLPSELTVFAPRHPLHPGADAPVAGITTRAVYPIARYLHAFDAAVSMAGYNSFHELLMAGVPSLFLARDTDTVDDQPARARFAELAGAALRVPQLGPDLGTHVERLLDDRTATRMRTTAAELYPANGAPDAAAIVAGLAEVAG